MAKDKTQPRAALTARREAERQAQAEAAAKRRRKLLINWLIAVVIVALVAAGITYVIVHLNTQKRELSVTGPAGTAPVHPPNATKDGLAILANPGATLASGAPTVDLYVDFQMSQSTAVMQFYQASLGHLADQGKIALRVHFLTTQDTALSNTASERGAIAAACADTVGKFWPYVTAAFTAAPTTSKAGDITFTQNQLTQTFASSAGITGDDLRSFQTCYNTRATQPFIETMNTSNQSTAIPGNQTYTSGIRTTPVVLADNKTVDITSDLYSQTAATADDAALLKLLTDAATPTPTPTATPSDSGTPTDAGTPTPSS